MTELFSLAVSLMAFLIPWCGWVFVIASVLHVLVGLRYLWAGDLLGLGVVWAFGGGYALLACGLLSYFEAHLLPA